MSLFKKLLEFNPTVIGILITLVLFGVVCFVSARKVKWNARMLAYAAICIAASFVLSAITLYRMPQGGSVTPASMMPVIAFAYIFGPMPGLICGLAYGLLNLMQDPYVIGAIQMLLDYPIAYAMLGVAGFAACIKLPQKLKMIRLPIAVLIAYTLRFAIHTLSGVIFFGENAAPGQPALLYSMGYQWTYLGPDGIVCLIVSCLPPLAKLIENTKKQFAKRAGGQVQG